MKHTAGYAKPRRLAAPKKKVRLDLQRRPMPEPEDELDVTQKSHFWKWVGLVALLHLVAISLFYLIHEAAPTPKPPDQFISLLPPGDVVKGTAGAQQAHKLGPTTPAPTVHHASSTPPPSVPAVPPKPITPPKAVVQPPKPAPTPLPPKPILKTDVPPLAPTKPTPPKPPKVKVDLHLADAPTPDKPVTKPKHHPKKPAEKNPDDSEAASNPDSAGLSREQIAAKLGEKLDAAGVKNALKSGTSGSANSHANSFADFYASIRDQVMSQWESPNLSDETAINPIVRIHVEKDGRVPAESVRLIQSSGNPSYDDSAVAAAKNLGYLHEPLPEGCPPDIPITFKLTR